MDNYVKAYSDIFVKFLFSSEGNEDILLDFLNDVLADSGFPKIIEAKVTNPFNLSNFKEDKWSIVDVKVVDEEGSKYNIEVQSRSENYYNNRILYYWSKMYSSQLKEGESYKLLKPVISINLLNYVLIKGNDKLHNLFGLFLKGDNDVALTDHIFFHFIEFPKLKKNRPDLYSEIEKWVYFFLNEGKKGDKNMKVLIKSDPIIKRAHSEYEKFTQDDELRELYENRIESERKIITDLEIAEKEGRKEGEKIGEEKGRKEGEKIGEKKGERKKAIETAKKMKEKGLDINFIVEITGLSKEEIEKFI